MFFKNSETPQDRSRPAAGSRTAIPSLLSAGICIEGNVDSSGEVQVDGVIEGDLVAGCVIVSEAGAVNGTIVAPNVRILGTVTGTITAGTIKLARTARVTGDIIHETLSIEEGAFVLGHCRRVEPDKVPDKVEARKEALEGEDPFVAAPQDDDRLEMAQAGDDAAGDGETLTIPAFVR